MKVRCLDRGPMPPDHGPKGGIDLSHPSFVQDSSRPPRSYMAMRALVLLIVLVMVLPMASVAIGDGSTEMNEGPTGVDGMYLYLKGATFDPLKEGPDVPEELLVEGQQAGIGLYIVQLVGPVQKEWPMDLVSNGIRMLGYLPSYSYLVEMDPWELDAVARLDFVRAVCPLHTAFKLEPALWQDQIEVTTEVTITVHKDMELVLSKVLGRDGIVISAVDDVIWAHIPSSSLIDIAEMEAVLWIERAPDFRLLNDVAANIINVNATVETHGLNGTGQIVAVCDSGLDKGVIDATMHDDLEGRINAIIDLWPGAGDGANDTNSGHGTHVSGSVLGNGTKSNGNIKGMAPGARLYFQATERNVDGVFATPVPLNTQVFQPAYTAGARVHTNSWGGSVSDGSYTARSREVDIMVWDNDDLVILFAVGNDGVDSNSDGIVDQDSIDAPSTAKNCISVGATESYRPTHGWGWDAGDFPAAPISGDTAADDPDGMAAFSSRGPVNDNRVKPDIVAPGTGILSLRSSDASGTGWGLPGVAEGDSTYYMFMGGTSMATPITAGTATLVRQFYVDHEGISPSAALVKGTLINGADDMPGQYASPKSDTGPVPDDSQGWGRVNLTNAIFPSPRELIYDDQNHPLDTDENYTYELDITSSMPFRISLVWTDYPALAAANPTLVNDLDLKVTAPNSSLYWGNNFNNGEADTGGSADTRNNVENVYFKSPSTGKYKIEVNASNIPQGPQSYAIIFSGVFSAPPPTSPVLNSPAPGAYTSARPTFNITSDDVNNDDISYRIELSKDDFTSLYRTINQSMDTTGWTKPIYASGEDAFYTIKVGDELEDGVKYYWRAWAYDGDNWSSSSVIRNFTVDATSPTGSSISINSGDNSTNSLSVTLTLSATDADSGLSGGLSGMSFSQDGASWTTWESYSGSKGLSLEDFQGQHRVYFRARDAVGNVADAVSTTIIYDDVAPSGLTISIGSGADYTNLTTVDLSISASDTTSGLDTMSFSNNGILWSTWEVFSSTRTGWDLTDASAGGNINDEVKTVHLRVRDNAGNVAPSVSNSISMDTTDPQGVILTINGGAGYTNNNLVHLSIDGTDAMSGISMMALNVEGAGYGPWEPFASTKFVTLPGGTGAKTIDILLKDKAGNVANEVQANIMLDMEPPSGIVITPDLAATGLKDVNFTLAASDTGSGLKDMSFSFDGAVWTPWEAWATGKVLTLPDGDGMTKVYIRVRDMADNIGGPASTSILLDTKGPLFSLTVNGGAEYASSSTIDVDIDLLEPTGDFDMADYEVSFSNDGLSWSPYVELTGDLVWDLAPGDGEKTVHVIVRDPVGNELESESDAIILDTIAPLNAELVMNDGAAYSTSSLVDCDLDATDENGLGYMSFSTDGTSWSAMEPWGRTKSLDIGNGNGIRTLYMRITDLAGNEVIVHDDIILDEDRPEIFTFRVNNASEDSVPFVTHDVVYFALTGYDEGTNMSSMSFGFDGITWGEWKDYEEEGHLAIPRIDGTVTVYARVQDKAGNIADPMGVQIILDMTPPTAVSLVIEDGALSTTEAMVGVSISAMDTTSGLDQYRYREGVGDWSNWHPFATSRSIRLSDGLGEKTISIEVRDKAGNVALEASDTIELVEDTTDLPKLFVTMTSHEGGETVKGNVMLTGTITGGTPSSIEIRIDGESWTSLDNRGSWSYTWNTANNEDGAHIVEVRASNGAEQFYSGPVVLTVKNKAETVNQGTSGIDATSLLIYIIISAVVGAAAGGGVAAAVRPKQLPPPVAPGPERSPKKKRTSSDLTKERSYSSKGIQSKEYGYDENPICAYCGYNIEKGEKQMICSCGRTYHEDCASEVNGYCEDCGSDLY